VSSGTLFSGVSYLVNSVVTELPSQLSVKPMGNLYKCWNGIICINVAPE
jgi:hypothetical protein